ncbi:hypothetical protein PF010_g21941 [Phytophthora fragariae]|uniref:Protein kinase domain-containing protein n=1 Tax=Phytophthora fragariae TaxID=53985 RepID=A0A6G0KAK1_9STRA|nr:hypothetical protein PF010_g21941 [Phytophthora fragariae]KAE9192136.1 hypothetical protein PF004_g21402 [Phytophthora fragariae]
MDRGARRTRRRQQNPRTPSTLKAGVAAALLLLIQGSGVNLVAGQSCGLAASTLSTSCEDACFQYEPCLAYSASGCPSGATCVTADQCAIQCFSKPLDDTDSFTFLVEFGSYDSSKELGGSTGSSLQDETDTYAAASNDAVSNISTIELQPTVTSFVLAGGSNANSSVKGKVAKVVFGSDVISTQSNVSNVAVRNLDLSTDATLQQLPVVLPTALQKLSLANTLLSAFPTLVANFTSLQTLDLAKNYITEIAATAALNSLVHLFFLNNELSSFRAVFPSLETLDLSTNNFTAIPASIFIHDSLKELRMKGNPLESPWFTKVEADFLVQLSTLDLENSDFSKPIDSCNTANRLTVHSLTVCISDTASDDDSDSDEVSPSSSSSTSNVLVIVGAIVGGLLVLGGVVFAGIWLYRMRVRRPQNQRSKIVRESYFGGISPPLARSPADKGYRGGRRTPVSGGPRCCSSDYEDDSYSSPRISTRSTHSNNSSMAYSLWNDEELLSLQVKFEDIDDIGTIGSGAFGIIWLVKYRGNQLLASKRLRSDQVTKQRTHAFIEEIKMVAAFDHPNIMDTHTIPYDDVRGANGNRLNDIAILQLVATGQLRPRFGASCPPELRMLAERCLAQDPEERPPAHVVAYELRVIQRSHYTLL